MDGISQVQFTEEDLKQECDRAKSVEGLAEAIEITLTEAAKKNNIEFSIDRITATTFAKDILDEAPSDALFDIQAAVRQGISRVLDMERNKKAEASMNSEKIDNIIKKLASLNKMADANDELKKTGNDKIFKKIVGSFITSSTPKIQKIIEKKLVEIQQLEKTSMSYKLLCENALKEAAAAQAKGKKIPYTRALTMARQARWSQADADGKIAFAKTKVAALNKAFKVIDNNLKKYYRFDTSGYRPEFGKIITSTLSLFKNIKGIYQDIRVETDASIERFDTDLQKISEEFVARYHTTKYTQKAQIPTNISAINADELKKTGWNAILEKEGNKPSEITQKFNELSEFINNMPNTWKKYSYMYMLLDPPAYLMTSRWANTILKPPRKTKQEGAYKVEVNKQQGIEQALSEAEKDEKETTKKILDTRPAEYVTDPRKLAEIGTTTPHWLILSILATEFVMTREGETILDQFEKTLSESDLELLNVDDKDVESKLTTAEKQKRNILLNKINKLSEISVLNPPEVISSILWSENTPDWILMKIASLSRNPAMRSTAEQVLETRGWAPKKEKAKGGKEDYVYDTFQGDSDEDAEEGAKSAISPLYQPTYSKVFEKSASVGRLSTRMAANTASPEIEALNRQIAQLQQQAAQGQASAQQQIAALQKTLKQKVDEANRVSQDAQQTATKISNSAPAPAPMGGVTAPAASSVGGMASAAKIKYKVTYKKG